MDRSAAEVAPGVFRLGTRIVNWYVVEDGGRLTAVDSGLPGYRDRLEADLGALGRRVEDVDAVVLTHSDSDHTGMAAALREAGATVLIHAADEPKLSKPGPKGGDASPAHLVPHMWRPAFWRFMGHMARAGGAKPPPVEGAQTFAGEEVLAVPGRPRAVHTPGHTPGHCALLFERQGVLFTGDELCTWNPLSGRLGPQLMPSGFNVSTDERFASLEAIERLQAELLLPGHGDPWRGAPAQAAGEARAAGRG